MRHRFILVLPLVLLGAARAAFAQCPMPQFVNTANLKIHQTGEAFPVSVKHAPNAKVEFKFEYRNINTKLFGEPDAYQPDTATKVANIVQSAAIGAESTTGGTITENQSGFWKMYVRSRCYLGEPNKAAPQPTAASDWSAPLEFVVLEKGGDGIVASVRVNPPTFAGDCPVQLCADAAVQSYYRKPVNFSWMLSNGKTAPGGTLTFDSSFQVKETDLICFPVGAGNAPGWTDPPHTGQINLVVNGKTAFPMPQAGYQVNCALKALPAGVKPLQKGMLQQNNFRMRKKVP
jgi:hypothetical protein